MIANQLDFIFFFYGLAFVLLGATCWSIARRNRRSRAWSALAGFGFLHGFGEWLDLTALIVGDTPAFEGVRTALMAVSFVLLLEFSRLKAPDFGLKPPERWIYVPLLALVLLVGAARGMDAAAITARYAIGFTGAVAACVVLARLARSRAGSARRYALLAAIGFALYAACAGLVVRAAPFWPASMLNHDAFSAVAHVPVQLVRGLLACAISFSIWAYWSEEEAAEVSSSRYTAYVRQQFNWTLVAMAAILGSGWMLTEHLGDLYQHNVESQAAREIELLSSRLEGESEIVDGMARVLARSPAIASLLDDTHPALRQPAEALLDLGIESAGARHGFLVDAAGTVVASSDRIAAHPRVSSVATAPYFRQALQDGAGHHYGVDPSSGRPAYFASQAIAAGDGRILGVLVLAKPLDALEADLRHFERPYALLDRGGTVLVSNLTEDQRDAGWPHRTTWTDVGGERTYVRHRAATHGEWSLVIFERTREIFANRFLGIVITLLATMMALIYLVGRGRWVHDGVQASKRLRLQELAQELGVKVLMPESDAAMAGRAAEKLRDAIAQADLAGVGRITCSFGVAQHVQGDTAETLLARADAALYRAKHNGRNQVQVAPLPGSRPRLSSV